MLALRAVEEGPICASVAWVPPSLAAGGFPIRTKVQAPVARDLVPRLDPLSALCEGPPRRLTLVRAPAGWGKSSLLSTWSLSPQETRPFAWLALDRADNDPIRFFLYVIQALQALAPTFGAHAEPILRAPGISLVDDVLPVLVNDLDALEDDLVLVIEDYHVIASPEVHEAVTFLLDHAPARLELVLTTRVEPSLPIARLRARGEFSRSRPPSSGSPPTRRRPCSTRSRASPSTVRRCHGSWTGPKAGRRASISLLCRCAAGRTPRSSSRPSPGTSATSSTT